MNPQVISWIFLAATLAITDVIVGLYFCPFLEGTFEHPDDCSKFYECRAGKAEEKSCPADQAFNATLSVCDATIDVNNCKPDGKAASENEVTTLTTASEESQRTKNPATQINERSLNFVLCPSDGRFMHPSNKAAYLECRNGEVMNASCPSGYLYDDKEKECLPSRESENAQHKTGKHLIDTLKCPDGYLYDEKEAECLPVRENENAQHTSRKTALDTLMVCLLDRKFVDPDDVTKYFLCKKGKIVHLQCREKQYFDAKLMKCVSRRNGEYICPDKGLYPDVKNCAAFYSCPSKGYAAIHLACPSPLLFESETKICVSPLSASCKQVEFNCEYEGHSFPHPEECGHYYVCTQGVPVKKSCADGLLFNKATLTCDWPKNVHCLEETSTPCQGNGLFPDPENCDSYFECIDEKITKKSCSLGLSFNAMTKSCDWKYRVYCIGGFRCTSDGLFPDPKDCSKFFSCKGGAIEHVSCPPGLHFNRALETCDLPMEEKCAQVSVCAEDGVYPDTTNCSKFYKCYGGQRSEKTCSNGLLFNAEKGLCDWPFNVQCAAQQPGYVEAPQHPPKMPPPARDPDVVRQQSNVSLWYYPEEVSSEAKEQSYTNMQVGETVGDISLQEEAKCEVD